MRPENDCTVLFASWSAAICLYCNIESFHVDIAVLLPRRSCVHPAMDRKVIRSCWHGVPVVNSTIPPCACIIFPNHAHHCLVAFYTCTRSAACASAHIENQSGAGRQLVAFVFTVPPQWMIPSRPCPALNPLCSPFHQGRSAATSVIRQSELNIVEVQDVTPIPHNGPRPKKFRRRKRGVTRRLKAIRY